MSNALAQREFGGQGATGHFAMVTNVIETLTQGIIHVLKKLQKKFSESGRVHRFPESDAVHGSSMRVRWRPSVVQ